MLHKHTAYIGIGSNLQNPEQQLANAVAALRKLEHTQCVTISPLYCSKAVGPEQPDYLNAAAKLHTNLTPIELLDALQAIEQQQNRVRTVHWGPRTIDLDILTFNNSVLDTPRLKVPHPYLPERSFVILPLYDIAPDLILPNGVTIESLWRACDKTECEQIDATQQS